MLEITNTTALLPLNLQFFGDAADDTGAEEADETTKEPTEADTEKGEDAAKPGATQQKAADLNALLAENPGLQGQFDKLVGKALNTAKSKWEREQSMTDEQRAEEKAQEMRQELARREQELQTRELRSAAISMLGEKGLPVELVECISLLDEASMKAHFPKVEKVFRAAVDKAVKEALKGAAPRSNAGSADIDELTRRIEKYRRK